jgi:hypothetical protein
MHCGTDRRWGTCSSLRAVLKPETYRNELPFCVAQRNHPSYFPVPRQDLTTSTTLLMLQRQAMFFRRHRWPIFIIVAVVFIATIAPLSFRFVPSRSPIYPVNDHKYFAPSNTASTSSFGGSHACPTTPPTQAITPDTQGRFNWRTISKHNPIDQYSQLPLDKSSPRPSIQATFGAAASQAKTRSVLAKRPCEKFLSDAGSLIKIEHGRKMSLLQSLVALETLSEAGELHWLTV